MHNMAISLNRVFLYHYISRDHIKHGQHGILLPFFGSETQTLVDWSRNNTDGRSGWTSKDLAGDCRNLERSGRQAKQHEEKAVSREGRNETRTRTHAHGICGDGMGGLDHTQFGDKRSRLSMASLEKDMPGSGLVPFPDSVSTGSPRPLRLPIFILQDLCLAAVKSAAGWYMFTRLVIYSTRSKDVSSISKEREK